MPHPGRNIDRHIGERIRSRRVELGLTQEQLAETLAVTYQQIQKYERGANRISAGRIHELARRLQVDIGYFFDGFEPDPGHAVPVIDHGGHQRPAIELARSFAEIRDPAVRAAVAGLVRRVVERGG